MDKIAVLIPCYNEELTIAKVIQDYKKELPEATIYVYDNNSTDATAEIANAEGAVVRHEYMQGKGNVIRRMFREIDAKSYLLVDGDDTYPAHHAREMIDHILSKKAEMVIGDRLSNTYYTENKRRFHNFGNNLVRSSINTLFKSDIKDIMTGYRAFSFSFVKTFPVLSTGFEIETEMTIHAIANNMQITNILVDYRDRPEGSVSKLNTYSDGFKVLKTIGRLFRNYKPLSLFFSICVLLIIIAICMFTPVLYDYFLTGLVPKFPTLIVAGFIAVAALQSLFSGLILSSIVDKNRQDFEKELVQTEFYYKNLLKENTDEISCE